MRKRNFYDTKLKEIQELLLMQLDDDDLGYSKRRNVNPDVWGPPGWEFLDKIVEGYPVRASHNDKVMMLEFLTSLGHMLPCERCRYNYKRFSQNNNPIDYVDSRARVRSWLKRYKNSHKI